MEQNWLGYPIDMEEHRGFALVDLAWADEEQRAGRTVCALIRVPFKDAGENGMGDQAEAEEIDAINDRLEKQMKTRVGAVNVARVRGGGFIDFIYYCKPGTDEQAQQTIARAFEGRDIELGVNEDAEWEMYASVYPSEEERQWSLDQSLIAHFEQMGEDLERERPADFNCYFPDEPGARAFAASAAKHGFKVMQVESSDESSDYPWIAVVRHGVVLDIDTVHPLTLKCMELSERHGGVFDGWEAQTDKSMDMGVA